MNSIGFELQFLVLRQETFPIWFMASWHNWQWYARSGFRVDCFGVRLFGVALILTYTGFYKNEQDSQIKT